ncbi:unnamed protein product [Lampetra planeri]
MGRQVVARAGERSEQSRGPRAASRVPPPETSAERGTCHGSRPRGSAAPLALASQRGWRLSKATAKESETNKEERIPRGGGGWVLWWWWEMINHGLSVGARDVPQGEASAFDGGSSTRSPHSSPTPSRKTRLRVYGAYEAGALQVRAGQESLEARD